jgi:hypothetical protein
MALPNLVVDLSLNKISWPVWSWNLTDMNLGCSASCARMVLPVLGSVAFVVLESISLVGDMAAAMVSRKVNFGGF